jgi:hypothetical protein
VYLYPKVAWAVWDSAQDAWGYDTQFMGPHFTTQEHQGIDGDGGAYQYAWDCDDDDNTLFARAAGYDPDYFKNCQAPIYNWGASFLDYGDGPYAVQPMYTGIVECWGSGDRCSTAHRDDESGPYYKLYGPLTGDLLEDPLFSNYEVLHQISSIQIKMDSNEVNLLGERFAPLKVSTLTDPVEIFKSYAVATEEESEEKTFTPIPKKIKSSLQLTFSGLEGEKASTENLVVSATSGRTSSTSATY